MFVDSREKRDDFTPFAPLRDWLVGAIEIYGGAQCALTIGVSNVGKSSLLLGLMRDGPCAGRQTLGRGKLKHGAPSIKDLPGHTRALKEYVLRDKPRMWCLDVPGMTPPPDLFAERPQYWYSLMAINALEMPRWQEEEVVPEVCSYVLFALNRTRNFAYVKAFGLEGPVEDVWRLLGDDWVAGSVRFLSAFRTGKLGAAVLDDLSQPYQPFTFRDWSAVSSKQRKALSQLLPWKDTLHGSVVCAAGEPEGGVQLQGVREDLSGGFLRDVDRPPTRDLDPSVRF